MNQQRLIPRVEVARSDGLKEVVPAFVVRSGLAIHVAPGELGTERQYTVTAIGCGRRLGMFQSIDEAERAFVRLESLTDWSTVRADDVERLGLIRGVVDTIVFECRDAPREDV